MSRRASRTSSKRVLFWKNAFPDLLCCINTFPGYYVFVEGASDRIFFQDYLIHKGADKIIRLRRRNYIPDFDFGPFLYRYKDRFATQTYESPYKSYCGGNDADV